MSHVTIAMLVGGVILILAALAIGFPLTPVTGVACVLASILIAYGIQEFAGVFFRDAGGPWYQERGGLVFLSVFVLGTSLLGAHVYSRGATDLLGPVPLAIALGTAGLVLLCVAWLNGMPGRPGRP